MDSFCRRRWKECDENDPCEFSESFDKPRDPLVSIPDPLQSSRRSVSDVSEVFKANSGQAMGKLNGDDFRRRKCARETSLLTTEGVDGGGGMASDFDAKAVEEFGASYEVRHCFAPVKQVASDEVLHFPQDTQNAGVHDGENPRTMICEIEENKENKEEIQTDRNIQFLRLERKNLQFLQEFSAEVLDPNDQLKFQSSVQNIMDENDGVNYFSTFNESLEKENQELRERLHQIIREKDEEWEKAVADLTSFLLEGCQSLEDASGQMSTIKNSFPNSNNWINDQIERAMKAFVEKERSMISLKKSLEDAQKLAADMSVKVDTLRGAMQAMTESHILDSDQEIKGSFFAGKFEISCEERRSEEEMSEKAERFFLKIAEAHNTMKEADLVVKKLLEANENASLEADRWKKMSEMMQMERDTLAEELERNRDFFAAGVEQTATLISVLEILAFEFKEKFEKLGPHSISDLKSSVLSSIEEMQECILDSKASLDSIFSGKASFWNKGQYFDGSYEENSRSGSSNSSECGEIEEQANHITFPAEKKTTEEGQIGRDLEFSGSCNITGDFLYSARKNQKASDLAVKIAKIDAILCHKRGTEALTTSPRSRVKDTKDPGGEILRELQKVKAERDQLQEHVSQLNERLDMARTMADEKEAIVIEARQEAEANRIYANEKEEQVRVLESTIAKLKSTVAVLENKVHEMKEEEDFRGRAHHLPWQVNDIYLDLYYSKKKIEELEKETARQAKEIKRYEEHLSELMLHSEAQSSLYRQKFQKLEAMVTEAKNNSQTSNHESLPTNKTDSVHARARSSASPFKCMSSLVQQLNSEKNRRLSQAKIRIEELETLAANRQKQLFPLQVCMLSARLAAADNMTHDVIRDLLEVKHDMNNYAGWLEMRHEERMSGGSDKDKLILPPQDEEILKLKGKIHHLLEEKDRWIEAMMVDILAMKVKLEKLQRQHQLMTAQNQMLKMDKRNLTKKLAKQDEIVKALATPKSFQELLRSPSTDEQEIGSSSSHRNKDLRQRLRCSRTLREVHQPS
ncbi:kinesin-like protein KIN-12E isoform X4 [Wolffia australiana]